MVQTQNQEISAMESLPCVGSPAEPSMPVLNIFNPIVPSVHKAQLINQFIINTFFKRLTFSYLHAG